MIPPQMTRALVGVFFLADVLFIFLHVWWGTSVVNLDEEANLTAWYSSVKLLFLAVVCVGIWREESRPTFARPSRRSAWLWCVMALFFLALSADETASLHERLARTIMAETTVGLDIREALLGGDQAMDSFAWVLLFSPIIVGIIVFLFAFVANRFRSSPGVLTIAVLAIVFYLGAVGLEATIYTMPSFAEWGEAELGRYQTFIAIEEGCELLGTTLFYWAFVTYRTALT